MGEGYPPCPGQDKGRGYPCPGEAQVRMGGGVTSPFRSSSKGEGYPRSKTEQQEYSIHGGQHASCVYAGGLSCFSLHIHR